VCHAGSLLLIQPAFFRAGAKRRAQGLDITVVFRIFAISPCAAWFRPIYRARELSQHRHRQ